MRKLLVTNLLVLAGLLALAEVMAALVAQRDGEPLAVVRLARRLKRSTASTASRAVGYERLGRSGVPEMPGASHTHTSE